MEAITITQLLSYLSGSVVGVILFVFILVWFEFFIKPIFRIYPQADISRKDFIMFLKNLNREHRFYFLFELYLSFTRLPVPISQLSPRLYYNMFKLCRIIKAEDTLIDDYMARRIVYLINKYNEGGSNE